MIRSNASRAALLAASAVLVGAPLVASADMPMTKLSPQKFVTNAAATNMMEVKLGKLAQEKSSNTQVKDFASQMVTDHTSLESKLETAAKSENLTVPSELPSKMQSKYDSMSKLSGAKFDQAYAKFNVKGHTKAVKLFKKEKASDSNKTMSGLAATGLPIIESHLMKAQTLQKTVMNESSDS